ncbi:type IV pilus twitching motility protein PilT [uncultured Ruminococcus sp.]|jgi:twitching motility protein PilT|uniref:type IV pilus twitching motility protein PilT n=1 Tax=Ruminococcus sp. TaxID=41978 RepID=UPI0026703070|nr:PilT/PilU family type 4a pilus ATPase [uncultured Ruminococcus sp.]MDR4007385.1 PilT/PilU family type 4a pilus ATPase [Ruminococcus sp.]
MEFDEMVRFAVENGASDIHLASNNLPSYRKNGKIMSYKGTEILDEDTVMKYIDEVLEPADYLKFCNTGDIDSAYQFGNLARFRINAFKQRHGATLVMRVIKLNPPKLGDLNLPRSIAKILNLQEGLVLVTGPTGSGKSTTLAALINEINHREELHIITIEDPVEYMHSPAKCIINQREVGQDSETYSTALKSALREDPDIILMGEIRDLESMSIALRAAETGHLVFSTLHTESAAKTIDRLIDMFPVERQKQALNQLSTTLKAVISQRLLPRSDRPGRIGAFEIMFVNTAIANLIREDKIPQIEQMISLNQQTGMITRKLSIENLLKRGLISKETADKYSYDVADNAILTGGNNSPQPGVPGIPQQTPQQLTAPMPQYSNLPQNSTNAYLNRR